MTTQPGPSRPQGNGFLQTAQLGQIIQMGPLRMVYNGQGWQFITSPQLQSQPQLPAPLQPIPSYGPGPPAQYTSHPHLHPRPTPQAPQTHSMPQMYPWPQTMPGGPHPNPYVKHIAPGQMYNPNGAAGVSQHQPPRTVTTVQYNPPPGVYVPQQQIQPRQDQRSPALLQPQAMPSQQQQQQQVTRPPSQQSWIGPTHPPELAGSSLYQDQAQPRPAKRARTDVPFSDVLAGRSDSSSSAAPPPAQNQTASTAYPPDLVAKFQHALWNAWPGTHPSAAQASPTTSAGPTPVTAVASPTVGAGPTVPSAANTPRDGASSPASTGSAIHPQLLTPQTAGLFSKDRIAKCSNCTFSWPWKFFEPTQDGTRPPRNRLCQQCADPRAAEKRQRKMQDEFECIVCLTEESIWLERHPGQELLFPTLLSTSEAITRLSMAEQSNENTGPGKSPATTSLPTPPGTSGGQASGAAEQSTAAGTGASNAAQGSRTVETGNGDGGLQPQVDEPMDVDTPAPALQDNSVLADSSLAIPRRPSPPALLGPTSIPALNPSSALAVQPRRTSPVPPAPTAPTPLARQMNGLAQVVHMTIPGTTTNPDPAARPPPVVELHPEPRTIAPPTQTARSEADNQTEPSAFGRLGLDGQAAQGPSAPLSLLGASSTSVASPAASELSLRIGNFISTTLRTTAASSPIANASSASNTARPPVEPSPRTHASAAPITARTAIEPSPRTAVPIASLTTSTAAELSPKLGAPTASTTNTIRSPAAITSSRVNDLSSVAPPAAFGPSANVGASSAVGAAQKAAEPSSSVNASTFSAVGSTAAGASPRVGGPVAAQTTPTALEPSPRVQASMAPTPALVASDSSPRVGASIGQTQTAQSAAVVPRTSTAPPASADASRPVPQSPEAPLVTDTEIDWLFLPEPQRSLVFLRMFYATVPVPTTPSGNKSSRTSAAAPEVIGQKTMYAHYLHTAKDISTRLLSQSQTGRRALPQGPWTTPKELQMCIPGVRAGSEYVNDIPRALPGTKLVKLDDYSVSGVARRAKPDWKLMRYVQRSAVVSIQSQSQTSATTEQVATVSTSTPTQTHAQPAASPTAVVRAEQIPPSLATATALAMRQPNASPANASPVPSTANASIGVQGDTGPMPPAPASAAAPARPGRPSWVAFSSQAAQAAQIPLPDSETDELDELNTPGPSGPTASAKPSVQPQPPRPPQRSTSQSTPASASPFQATYTDKVHMESTARLSGAKGKQKDWMGSPYVPNSGPTANGSPVLVSPVLQTGDSGSGSGLGSPITRTLPPASTTAVAAAPAEPSRGHPSLPARPGAPVPVTAQSAPNQQHHHPLPARPLAPAPPPAQMARVNPFTPLVQNLLQDRIPARLWSAPGPAAAPARLAPAPAATPSRAPPPAPTPTAPRAPASTITPVRTQAPAVAPSSVPAPAPAPALPPVTERRPRASLPAPVPASTPLSAGPKATVKRESIGGKERDVWRVLDSDDEDEEAADAELGA